MTPEDLNKLSQHRSDEHLSELSCDYFRRQPREAERLFGAHFYSTRDGWQPLCRTLDVTRTVPETAPLVAALRSAYSADGDNTGCKGSMTVGFAREQRVAAILAVVETAPDIRARDEARAARTAKLGYTPGLAHWAQLYRRDGTPLQT